MKLPIRKKEKLRYPLTVGSCAAALGVSTSLLRVYDREGICSPSRDSDGRRLYLPRDVAKLRRHRAAVGAKE